MAAVRVFDDAHAASMVENKMEKILPTWLRQLIRNNKLTITSSRILRVTPRLGIDFLSVFASRFGFGFLKIFFAT